MLWFFAGFAAASLLLVPLGLWLCGRAKKHGEAARAEAYRVEKLATLGALAGGLAHEIKNPLSTFGMNLQLLEEDLEGLQGAVRARISSRLNLLRREAERLNETLDDFLRFAQFRKLDLATRDLRELMDELINFLEPELKTRNIDMLKQFPQEPVMVELDANLFKQAVLNIMLNAEQAIERDGQIVLQLSDKGDYAQLDFIDTGVGISPEDLKRVFNIYFSTRQNGSGLGLATTKRIIEAHGGSIKIASEPGKGTNVTVKMPKVAEKTREAPPA